LGAEEGNVDNRSFVRGRIDAGLLVGVMAVVLSGCQGSSERGAEVREFKADGESTPQRPGAQVGAGPVTREQRVAALRQALARPLSHSVEGLDVKTLPNGKRAVHLGGRFGHAMMLRINPDGTREHGCFDSAEHAVEFATREEGHR
jgi:hypothetical protein